MAVVWDYNGSDTLTADTTFADADQAAGIVLLTDDGNASVDNQSGSVGNPVTLTLTTIGGLSAGDKFIAHLYYTVGGAEDQIIEGRLLEYGVADATTELTFAWDYDGASTVIVTSVVDDPEAANGVFVECNDPDSTVYTDNSPTAGDPLNVNIVDVGGLSPGDPFGLEIFSGTGSPIFVSGAALEFGTPSSGGTGPVTEDDALLVRVGGARPNYIQQDFTTPPGLSNVYVEAEVLFDDLALRTWEAQSGGFLELQGAEMLCRVYLVKQGVRWVWAAYGHGTGKDVWAVGTDEVVAGTHTISVHFDSSTVAVVADTDSVVIPTGGRAYAVAAGQTFLADNSGAVAYIASVKVGTTAGDDDLLSEDFDAITITGSLYGSDENGSAEVVTLAAAIPASEAGTSSEVGSL